MVFKNLIFLPFKNLRREEVYALPTPPTMYIPPTMYLPSTLTPFHSTNHVKRLPLQRLVTRLRVTLGLEMQKHFD